MTDNNYHTHTFEIRERTEFSDIYEDIICVSCGAVWTRHLKEKCRECGKWIQSGKFLCSDECSENWHIGMDLEAEHDA